MAGGKEHGGELCTGARGHGWRNRKHRERGREQGISSRPIRRPGDAAEAAVAMAGGADVVGAHG